MSLGEVVGSNQKIGSLEAVPAIIDAMARFFFDLWERSPAFAGIIIFICTFGVFLLCATPILKAMILKSKSVDNEISEARNKYLEREDPKIEQLTEEFESGERI